MTTYLGKSCSFCLPRVPFVNCRQFMYLVISLLVLRAGYGIWLYQFLIIAYLFTSPGHLEAAAGGRRAADYRPAYTALTVTAMGTPDLLEAVSISAKETGIHAVTMRMAKNHNSIYLWFICFPWWSIDKLENLHEQLYVLSHDRSRGRDWVPVKPV